MKNSKPKVIKVIYSTYSGSEKKEYLLFNDGKMHDGDIKEQHICIMEAPEDVANRQHILSTDFIILLGEKEYTRSNIHLRCNGKNRDILEIQDSGHENTKHVIFLIDKTEWKAQLLAKIEEMEKEFYLTEYELLEEAHNLLKRDHSWVHFKRQVTINNCIADGLAFTGHTMSHEAKIIGFEVKTNQDNYLRLHNQINSYLSICDEVYLVIEDKKIPRDLPFYIGVIQVQDGTSKLIRHAVSLKHSIDVAECWKTLLKNLCTHIGLKRETPLISFFTTVENIKRKLIWNQFVIGWHQTYVEEYVQLTDEEKKLIRLFFGGEKKDGGVKSLVRILTLDNWADNIRNPAETEVNR